MPIALGRPDTIVKGYVCMCVDDLASFSASESAHLLHNNQNIRPMKQPQGYFSEGDTIGVYKFHQSKNRLSFISL